jgi:hypothetical protein
MLVDTWSKVGKAIMVAVEELHTKVRDEDLVGGAKSAVVYLQSSYVGPYQSYSNC